MHLWVVIATVFSWLGLGLFKGLGYCFLTDWHWDIKRSLGETNLPNSFIKYIIDRAFNTDLNASFVDTMTAVVFGMVVIITTYFQLKKRADSRG
jgi:hypothetical protein